MNKKTKKSLGLILLVVALFFINPIFDFSDAVILPIYSIYSGVDVTLENLPVVYLDYFLWCMVIGVLLLIISMNLLGWNLKRLWRKIDPGKYKISLALAVLAVLAVALLNLWSAQSGVFGSLTEYTLGDFGDGWWSLFFKFVIVIFAIPSICYYFLVKRDKSESVGIFLFSLIIYFGGLADLFYFVLQKLPLPAELPWLMGSPFINFISIKLLGYSTVTNISLLVSIIISFGIAWMVAKFLKEKL